MSDFYDIFVSLRLEQWSILSAPFVVLIGATAWLLTPGGGRWVERRMGEGAALKARAGRRLQRSTPRPRQAERPLSARVDRAAPILANAVQPVPESMPEAEPAAAPEASPFNRRCKMDLAATKAGLELMIELPGVEEKDLKIQVANDVLTISGHMSFEPDREERNYRLIERDYGTFSRSIDLPEGVPPDKIRANLNRGVLTLTIPNPTKADPRTIEVQGPPMHLCETTDGLELTVDVPGLAERDVEVSISRGVLTVRGERKPEYVDARAAFMAQSDDRPGRLLRSVEVPSWVNVDQIAATLSNGVLTVSMPRPSPLHARRIEVRAAPPSTLPRRRLKPASESSPPPEARKLKPASRMAAS
jgi:HSP20 family protein